MSRRLDVELTSTRDDGTWTWRAAGAKQPKGEVPGSLLYADAAIGDVCKVEADFLLDGIEILEVFPPKQKKERVGLLEMKPRELRDDELVTTTRVSRDRDDRRGGKGGRGRGRDRDGRRDRGDRSERGDRGPRADRGPRPAAQDQRPKPKRLRPRRTHRDAVLAEVPEEHRPIAEQVLRGGIPAVREAIDKQNAEAKEAGTPEIAVAPVLKIAEDLVPKMRAAEWHDRADAAIADIDELDLRDLRSVVVASDAARDDEARALADQLKTQLSERIEKDHAQWLSDVTEAVDGGRTVRALRLSSRPVKAGAPLPPELATKLTAMAAEGLAADVAQDRWATVIDAVAFSPIRNAVVPSGFPEEPSKDLLDAVRKVADRVPSVAAHFGIDPAEAAKAKRRRPAKRGGRASGKPTGSKAPEQAAKAPTADTPPEAATTAVDTPEEAAAPAVDTPKEAASAVDTPEEAAAPDADAPEADTPATDAPEAADGGDSAEET